MSNIQFLEAVRLQALPASPSANTLYFIKASGETTGQIYLTNNSGTIVAEMMGEQGPQGPQGDQGVDGLSFDPDAVGLAADRSTYDDEAFGFSFLDTENNLIYFKLSATSGDWSTGITFAGQQGPEGSIQPVLGDYNSANTYDIGDVILYNGSSYISLQDNNLNNTPPTPPTTSNSFWQMVAQKGTDGESINPASLVGVNTTADATNKLAVKSDAVLFSHDDVTPGSGDIRTNLNKAAIGNTAAILFQTAHSGRAEFGLTGDDDFHMKVSPDGSTFYEGLIIDKNSGRIGVNGRTPDSEYGIFTNGIRSNAPVGSPHLSTNDESITLANGATIDFNNFSGMIFMVNLTTGSLAQFICGGANTNQVALTGAPIGTLTFAASPSRYVFTNNTGSTASYKMLTLRARDFA